eukprot:Selendium_serpulae@DN9122_c0_g1_i1.p2
MFDERKAGDNTGCELRKGSWPDSKCDQDNDDYITGLKSSSYVNYNYCTNCELGQWEQWEACSNPCGPGDRTRRQTVVEPPYESDVCPLNFETEACVGDEPHCKKDCEVSPWAEWSVCSVTCGRGSSERTRTVTQEPQGGGAACPPLTESKDCLLPACSVDCEMSDWGSWTVCSVSCGGGGQKREMAVETVPRFGGAPCPPDSETEETRVCNTHSCGVSRPHMSVWNELVASHVHTA